VTSRLQAVIRVIDGPRFRAGEGEVEMEMVGARFWVAVAIFLRVRLAVG
jgi:hypothetical protein